tara:strand:+ start:414 stop:1106 length:693 start_codon:yes stop_codon:yes gene_type:complete
MITNKTDPKLNQEKNNICCICFDPAVSVYCSTCKEGCLCTECFYDYVDYNNYDCPICREPLKSILWYKRVHLILEDHILLGIYWIFGYINLFYGLQVQYSNMYRAYYNNTYLFSLLCLIVGKLTVLCIKSLIIGSAQELDELYVMPYADPTLPEEEFQRQFLEYRRQTKSFCFVKKCVHFVAKQLTDLENVYENLKASTYIDADLTAYKVKITTMLCIPHLATVIRNIKY